MIIRNYNNEQDRLMVINLLKQCFSIDSPHNDPELSIDMKIRHNDGLFFVLLDNLSKIRGCCMAGYDGHRGWIYSLCVDSEYRGKGGGKLLVEYAENELKARGCMKLNLQVLASNENVVAFYKKCGFSVEERISIGKKLY